MAYDPFEKDRERWAYNEMLEAAEKTGLAIEALFKTIGNNRSALQLCCIAESIMEDEDIDTDVIDAREYWDHAMQFAPLWKAAESEYAKSKSFFNVAKDICKPNGEAA